MEFPSVITRTFLLLGICLAILSVAPVKCFVWRTKQATPEGTIVLNYKNMKNSQHYGVKKENDRYNALVKSFQNLTIDEKCEQGKEFGIGFQTTSPYVIMGPGDMKKLNETFSVSGVIPHVTLDIMKYCCKKSKITFGHHFKSALDIETHYSDESEMDLSFPLYGLDGKKTTQFKDFPFIPIVTAPKIVLLVPDSLFQEMNNRTEVLLRTIFNTWPMLIFIIVSAMLSGLTVWLLDRKKNSNEFPPTFFSGAWEGVWWAFVTMTTVGYGDRSPKSPYARAFCIIWILFGIIIISLFTGLVAAALNVSSTPVFNVAGARIGAVRGSMEYKVAIEMNAEVIGFEHLHQMLSNLTQTDNLHGALLDNFILSSNTALLTKAKLRIEREIEHPVTYGIVMKRNSTKIEECFRRYTRRHPDKIFEIIAKQLKPVKNPTDDTSLATEAAETFYFYKEPVFKLIVYIEMGILIIALVAGVSWEVFVRNKNSAAYRMVDRFRKKPKFGEQPDYNLNTTNHCKQPLVSDLDGLIEEYNDFHTKWVERVRQLSHPKAEKEF